MKAIQIITAAISFMTWYATDQYSLDKIAGRTPKNAPSQMQATTAASNNREPAAAAKIPDTQREELERKLANDFPYMTGEYEVLIPHSGEKYKYWVQVELTLVPKGSLEGDGLFANVLITYDKSERVTSFYKAKVTVESPTRMVLALENRDLSKFMKIDAYLTPVEYFPDTMILTSADPSSWTVSIPPPDPNYERFRLAGRVMKTPTQSLSRYEGKWSGNVGEYPFKLEFKQEGKFLTATYRMNMTYPCRYTKVNARLSGDNRVSILGGEVDKNENFSGCVVPALRAQLLPDGKLKVIHYWNDDEGTEGVLTR